MMHGVCAASFDMHAFDMQPEAIEIVMILATSHTCHDPIQKRCGRPSQQSRGTHEDDAFQAVACQLNSRQHALLIRPHNCKVQDHGKLDCQDTGYLHNGGQSKQMLLQSANLLCDI